MIGNDIEITVLEIKGDQIKLGVKAPVIFLIIRTDLKIFLSLFAFVHRHPCHQLNFAFI